MIELRAEITRRYKCTIIVFEYNLKNYPDEVANDHSYKAVTFQELPALEKLTIKKRSKYEEPSVWIEDPSTVTVEKYFLRNGRCYHILSHFMFCETVPTNLPLYLDSFNVNAINQDIKND
jgi:hypothetical protein